MLHITRDIEIPESEIRFTASRSGGPGGQNVNKVSSKITLAFDIGASAAFSEEQKRELMAVLASRINKEGVLQVVSQRTRSQELNRTDALARFAELLRRALTPRRARIKTRVPAAAKRQRLEEKKRQGLMKQVRSGKVWD
jgi:ribosome-associated protein